jgi:5'-phosphate synthase pdxT subunit
VAGSPVRVGVLALQGDFAEHQAMLAEAGVASCQVRTVAELEACGALIIPGGESTTMAKLMDAYGLRSPLTAFARSGRPVWGTCAGLIMLAARLEEDRPAPLGLMGITVRRNGYGRQVDSFSAPLNVKGMAGGPFHAVFIRAPVITAVGQGVEVLAALEDGSPVAVRAGNLLATSFHPELTRDARFHAAFWEMAAAPSH